LATTRARARRLPAEQRREHLLDVAALLVRERGFEALTMEALRERAGVSRGLGYAHFANAEELAFALYGREVADLDGRVAAATAAAQSFDARVRAGTRAYFDFVAERGDLLATLQTRLGGHKLRRSLSQRLGGLIGYWSRQLEDEFGVSPELAESLARAALAASDALARAWRAKRLARGDAERLSVEFMLGGLRRSLGAGASRRKAPAASGARR
jgi:AcrR family transcriptional regulator